MIKETIHCPKDPELEYFREVCRNVFRKGNIRHWCKQCELFINEKQDSKEEE